MDELPSPDELKEKGNVAFAAKKFDEAIEHYSRAIQLEKNNHVFYSNRSASYAGLGQWQKAADDAKECIKLDPTFVKGYYRLAAAQMELKQLDKAEATIRQALAMDNNNPQLVKQMRAVKQMQKVAEAKEASARMPPTSGSATPSGSLGHFDEATSKELQELYTQRAKLSRELQTVQVNLQKSEREFKISDITKSELSELPNDAKCYRSVGKMFLLSSKSDVENYLDNQKNDCKKKESDMKQKVDYLERTLKSLQQNIQELEGGSNE